MVKIVKSGDTSAQKPFAGLVELADTQDLGSCAQA